MFFRKKKSRARNIVGDWRTTIRQNIRTGGTSSAKRRLFYGWAKTLTVCTITVGAFALFAIVWAKMTSDASEDGFAPLKIEMRTDGVLDEKWFHAWTGVDFGSRDVSITQLRKKLERYGQVKNAEVTRGRGNSLRVVLRERNAVGRLAFADGSVKMLADDGVLFPAETFVIAQDKLPFITGARTEERADGLEQARGIAPLLKFLAIVRRDFPEMLLEWRSVSVKDLPDEIYEEKFPQPWAVIRVKTIPERMNPAFPPISEIVFSAQNFEEELALWGAQDTQAKLEKRFTDEDRGKQPHRVVFITNRKNAHRPIPETRIIPLSDSSSGTAKKAGND